MNRPSDICVDKAEELVKTLGLKDSAERQKVTIAMLELASEILKVYQDDAQERIEKCDTMTTVESQTTEDAQDTTSTDTSLTSDETESP